MSDGFAQSLGAGRMMPWSSSGARHGIVRRVRPRMDALELAVQGKPVLPLIVRGLRTGMRWAVGHSVSPARLHQIRRPEVAEARTIMADAPPQPVNGPKVLFVSFREWRTFVAWGRDDRPSAPPARGPLRILLLRWEACPSVRSGGPPSMGEPAVGIPRRPDDRRGRLPSPLP